MYLTTFGSRGDNEPFAALAHAAAQAGHDVVFAHTSDSPSDPNDPFEHWALPGSLENLIADQGVSLGKALRHYQSVWKPALEAVYDASIEQIRHARPDVVVFHPKVLPAPVIAHQVGALAVAAELAPTLTPTREFPAAGIPWNLPRWLNRPSYRLIDLGLAVFGNRAKKLARSLGVTSFHADLTLCPVSPTLIPQPRDWPETAVITGQWNRPLRPTGTPRPRARAIRARGKNALRRFWLNAKREFATASRRHRLSGSNRGPSHTAGDRLGWNRPLGRDSRGPRCPRAREHRPTRRSFGNDRSNSPRRCRNHPCDVARRSSQRDHAVSR